MPAINLPIRFKNKLEENYLLDGIVKKVLAEFGKILEGNNLYFFEEYTDHGVSHIDGVVHASDKLITEPTYNNVLTQKDIAYYLLAVILHDLGMHLRPEGFKALIEGHFDRIRNTENWIS